MQAIRSLLSIYRHRLRPRKTAGSHLIQRSFKEF
ncbi:hypothetical protein ABIB73_000418 [Bradyrhizobium sp. F1.4.3]